MPGAASAYHGLQGIHARRTSLGVYVAIRAETQGRR